MNKFDPSKKYVTRLDRYPYRNYCTDAGGDYPLHGAYFDGEVWCTVTHTASMSCYVRDESDLDLDLVEVNPYDDFQIDEPVMVRDFEDDKWKKGYFAGINSDGAPMTYTLGNTRWSSGNTASVWIWIQCRRPTEEELNT